MPSGRPQPVPPIAHAQLWDRHRDSVRAVLWRLLGPGGDIDDCVNEVFARLFERLPTLRRPASLPAFVTGIARRVAFAERRRRRNERLRTVHDPHAEIADPRWPAAMHYIGATSALLRRLPDGPRRLFVLRHLMGLDTNDVATTEGLSRATTNRRLRRLRDTVRLLGA